MMCFITLNLPTVREESGICTNPDIESSFVSPLSYVKDNTWHQSGLVHLLRTKVFCALGMISGTLRV